MIDTSRKDFHNRRAIQEKALADNATEIVQVVAHELLSSLHAQKASNSIVDIPTPPAQNTALEMSTVKGNVIISDGSVQIASLTPIGAELTSDLLLTNARKAGRQVSGKAK